jgi:hypothetical protein
MRKLLLRRSIVKTTTDAVVLPKNIEIASSYVPALHRRDLQDPSPGEEEDDEEVGAVTDGDDASATDGDQVLSDEDYVATDASATDVAEIPSADGDDYTIGDNAPLDQVVDRIIRKTEEQLEQNAYRVPSIYQVAAYGLYYLNPLVPLFTDGMNFLEGTLYWMFVVFPATVFTTNSNNSEFQ